MALPPSATLDRARALHQAGELEEAESLCRAILEREPGHPEALNRLGLVAYDRGQPECAAELIGRAIAARPGCATYHMNLGNLLETEEELEGALVAYLEAARLEPEAPDAHFNVGLMRLKLSRPAGAETSLRRVLVLTPNDAAAHFNLGHALRDQGRWDASRPAYAAALELRPGWAPALNAWAFASRALGHAEQAIEAYRQSLAVSPDDPVVLNNLGNALRDVGDRVAARDCYRRAIELAPRLAELHLNLALTQRDAREFESGLEACRRALELDPALANAWPTLASLIAEIAPSRHQPELEQELITCLRCDQTDPQSVAGVAAGQIRLKHRLDPATLRSVADYRRLIPALGADDLLLAFLARAINVDAELELVLAGLRRVLLTTPSGPHAGSDSGADLAPSALMSALALQCFANEFVLGASAEEQRSVEGLRERLAASDPATLDPASPQTRLLLLRLALYCPLSTLEELAPLRQIDDERWGPHLAPVVARALRAPLVERAEQGEIESLAPVRDPVSRRVAAQYEENPYPRWLSIPEQPRVGAGLNLRRRFPGFSPPDWLDSACEALVAGCGTGYEPIELALRQPRWQITGIDLSRASLAYASRMARERRVSNVRFVHGDILELDRLEQRFSLISASGVLHHMGDPLVGWQRLVDRLVDQGIMRVALYSRTARRPIAAARAQIARESLRSTAPDIRSFRQRVLRGELSTGLGLSGSPDFYTLSACRDLLFHTEEHDFDLDEIASCLERLGLRFIGFEHAAPGVDEHYSRLFPDDPSRTSLASWARFEAAHPGTFVAMYSFWCQKA